MSNETEAARSALEAAYVNHIDDDPNKYELFAYADDLPAEIDDTEAVSIAASMLAAPPEVETSETTSEKWENVSFTDTTLGVYPTEMVGYDAWMTYKGDKLPYAPWTDHSAPAPCSKHDTTADDCDCSARYKWGWEPNRRPFDKAQMALDDDRLNGLVFIQTEDDPFVFVDGDDVRCPETGDVHPTFIAFLEHFGLTYADVSTSGAGVHAVYRGDLPADETVATWQIDSEPWGANDDPPVIEIYSGKHVNVTTGDHVDGTPKSVAVWDAETTHQILEVNGCVGKSAREELQEAYEGFDGGHDSGEHSDHIRAIERLDARRVAENTIVKKWTSSSNDNLRSFLPTWGDSTDGGTANFVDENFWIDGGENGGRGGPIEMALIDLGELRNKNAKIGWAKKADFWTGYEHLRDLGFDLPEPRYAGDDDTRSVYYSTDLSAHTEGDPWSDPDAMLEACLSVRKSGAVPSDAEPPTLALLAITRELLGVEEPSSGTKEAAVEVFHEMGADDFDGEKVLL